MTLKINSVAPDFKAKTSEGDISFHEWLGDSWGVLFSHPKDFTPVCTTELGSLAQMRPEFDKRNVKVIGLSVDKVDDHKKWLEDIKDVTGTKPNYPIIADENLEVAIITPDRDIIPDSETLNPAYLVFDNYEIILKWNRSLRFALAVCTLKDKISNEL